MGQGSAMGHEACCHAREAAMAAAAHSPGLADDVAALALGAGLGPLPCDAALSDNVAPRALGQAGAGRAHGASRRGPWREDLGCAPLALATNVEEIMSTFAVAQGALFRARHPEVPYDADDGNGGGGGSGDAPNSTDPRSTGPMARHDLALSPLRRFSPGQWAYNSHASGDDALLALLDAPSRAHLARRNLTLGFAEMFHACAPLLPRRPPRGPRSGVGGGDGGAGGGESSAEEGGKKSGEVVEPGAWFAGEAAALGRERSREPLGGAQGDLLCVWRRHPEVSAMKKLARHGRVPRPPPLALLQPRYSL